MAIKEIITDVEKFNDRAKEIDVKKENNLMREITLNLKHTIRENNLIALAAPQIGYDKRIFCVNFNGDIRTFVNPVQGQVGDLELSREKCPTLSNKEYIRPRHNSVAMMYQTPLGKIESTTFKGMAAHAVQYGVDILDGLLLSDIGFELDENWDKASQEERDEVIKMYLESLDLQEKNIKKDIEQDQEAKDLMKQVNVAERMARGEITVEPILNNDEEEESEQK